MNIYLVLKYLSITIICCAISMYGAYIGGKYSKKVAVRKEFIRLLCHILSSLKYTSKNIAEICHSFESKVFQNDFSDYFVYLSPEESTALHELFSNLGRTYSFDNALNISSHTKEILEEYDSLHSKTDKTKAILMKKLGISAAILTAIILI